MLISSLQRISRRHRAILLLAGLTLTWPLVFILSITTGPVTIGLADTLGVLFGNLDFAGNPDHASLILIIETIRLPRTLTALVVGGALAISGATMQGLFRNPMADPGIIGVASGSALGAGIAMVLFPTGFPIGSGSMAGIEATIWQEARVSLFAFTGGMAVTCLVYLVGAGRRDSAVLTLLLAGVAVNALAAAAIGILSYIADDLSLRGLTYWQMGALGSASWARLVPGLAVLLPVVFLLCRYGSVINGLLLGDAEARHLGIAVRRVRLELVFLVAVAVSVSVALSGLIGFIGLVVPHMIRLLAGPDHRILLPASALLGGIVLVLADLLARTMMAPVELPVGIMTALIGSPVFMSMLWQQRQRIL